LILNAAASTYYNTIPPVVVDCDNNGVVSHGNNPLLPLPTVQSQADILQVFKNLVSIQPLRVRYKYVQSHADNTNRWQDYTLKECINIKVDSLVKKALKAAHCTGKYINSSFPNEQLWITMKGKKVTGSLRNELEDFWGCSTA
jgi:hypothetical protein